MLDWCSEAYAVVTTTPVEGEIPLKSVIPLEMEQVGCAQLVAGMPGWPVQSRPPFKSAGEATCVSSAAQAGV